jgi:general secretion pathway protein A
MHEVGPYIEHRMKIVNWTGTPRFDPSAFEAIYHHAGGVPRRINTLMTRVLLMASLEKSAVIDAALIGAVIADLSVENPAALSAGAAEPVKLEAVLVDNVRPAVHAANAQDQAQIRELSSRLEMLEAKSEEQEAALRRVLGLLIDWVERDEAVRSGYDLKQNNAR